MRGFGALLSLIVLAGCGAAAQEVSPGEAGRLSVGDGRLFLRMEGDERLLVRPAGILIPTGDEPMADEAAASLMQIAEGRTVSLSYPGETRDRYDRAIAIVTFEDGTTLQQALVSSGWARVYSWPGETAGIADLLALETEARETGRGLWADPAYQVRSPDPNLLALDLEGVSVSSGAACSSGKVAPSHVLAAMGVPVEVARTAIRLSLGWQSDERSLDLFAKRWVRVLEHVAPGHIRAA